MSRITFKGSPIDTVGSLPAPGSLAPDFALTAVDLSDKELKDFAGKKKILNIVPSLDTSVCATSARRFDQEIGKRDNAVLLNVSADLPFAQARFCKTEGLANIVTLSQMRDRDFGKAYGVEMSSGPLKGLLARAVVVLDSSNAVVYTQLVEEIGQEPDYNAALRAVDAAR
jgi:thioredoxin-dependent peroxiredoxin